MRPFLLRLAIAVALVLALAGCSGSAGATTWTYAPRASVAIAAAASTAPAPSAQEANAGTTVVEAFDLGFRPAMVIVAAAGTYQVEFRNTGSTLHDLTLRRRHEDHCRGRQERDRHVTVPKDGLTFLCSIPGHAAAGMTGTVMVEGAAPTPFVAPSHPEQRPPRSLIQTGPSTPSSPPVRPW